MDRYRLSKRQRLRTNLEFKAVLDRRWRRSDGLLMVSMAENRYGRSRLGVSVSRSCGESVVRNRLKRLIREAFRTIQDRLPAGHDYVVRVSPGWRRMCGTSEGGRLNVAAVRRSLERLAGDIQGKLDDNGISGRDIKEGPGQVDQRRGRS